MILGPEEGHVAIVANIKGAVYGGSVPIESMLQDSDDFKLLLDESKHKISILSK